MLFECFKDLVYFWLTDPHVFCNVIGRHDYTQADNNPLNFLADRLSHVDRDGCGDDGRKTVGVRHIPEYSKLSCQFFCRPRVRSLEVLHSKVGIDYEDLIAQSNYPNNNNVELHRGIESTR